MIEKRTASQPEYGAVAKSLHWGIFLLLAAQYAVAWTMPHIGRNTRPEGLVGLHLSIGFLIIALVIVRLVWRLSHPVPLLADGVPRWQNVAAHALHGLIYLVLVLLPLMGWANASARGWSLRFFGLFPVPSILPTDSPLGRALGDIHGNFGWILIGLVAIHVLAALYHHFVRRDRVLRRMVPGLR